MMLSKKTTNWSNSVDRRPSKKGHAKHLENWSSARPCIMEDRAAKCYWENPTIYQKSM